MFERFKNGKTKECEPEQEYEYPVGTVPLHKHYICIIDLLEGGDPKDPTAWHECPCFTTKNIDERKPCRKCISNWLNSESKDNHFI